MLVNTCLLNCYHVQDSGCKNDVRLPLIFCVPFNICPKLISDVSLYSMMKLISILSSNTA